MLYLQAYHSQFTSPPQVVGNMALLPLRTQFKGPAAKDSQSALLIYLVSVLVKQFLCVNFFIFHCIKCNRASFCYSDSQRMSVMPETLVPYAYLRPFRYIDYMNLLIS